MALDREPLYLLIETKLNTVPKMSQPVQRRFTEDPEPSQQPCIFMETGDEIAEVRKGQPILWRLYLTLHVYVRTDDDPSVAPSTLLNNLLRDIETALEWTPGDGMPAPKSPTTLGGLAAYCAINGKVEKYEGSTNGGQGGLIIPIEILTTAG